MIISDKEKRTTAVHEAGHALVARFAGDEADQEAAHQHEGRAAEEDLAQEAAHGVAGAVAFGGSPGDHQGGEDGRGLHDGEDRRHVAAEGYAVGGQEVGSRRIGDHRDRAEGRRRGRRRGPIETAKAPQDRIGHQGPGQGQEEAGDPRPNKALAEPGLSRLDPALEADAEHQEEGEGAAGGGGQGQVRAREPAEQAQDEEQDGGRQQVLRAEGGGGGQGFGHGEIQGLRRAPLAPGVSS